MNECIPVVLALDLSGVSEITGNMIYGVQALIAIWGGFCVALVWMRINRQRFTSEREQDDFLTQVEGPLLQGDFDGASQICGDDPRATSQLALLAMNNRRLGYSRVRQLVMDRFQRDVLAELQYRLSWVNTVIKTAPMLGLFGTVVGMMAAFGKLKGKEGTVNADQLAGDISMALITTAVGLAIAIPLLFCMASINVRINKLEDLVGAGMTRFLESLKIVLSQGRG